jgi:hypothetical protein
LLVLLRNTTPTKERKTDNTNKHKTTLKEQAPENDRAQPQPQTNKQSTAQPQANKTTAADCNRINNDRRANADTARALTYAAVSHEGEEEQQQKRTHREST